MTAVDPAPTTGPSAEPVERAGDRRPGWARRRRSLVRLCHGYARNRAGVAAACLLLAVVGAAVAAPLFIGADDLSAVHAPGAPLRPPSSRFPLGTDGYGRSMLAVTVWGARISLVVGLLATVVSVGIGALVGICAGHFRGWTETVLMRVTDWFLVLPTLVLAAALASVLPQGTATVVVAIGVTSWATAARLVRAQTLTVEARPYVERARALGGGHWHVATSHVLPNVAPLVLAQTTLTVSGAILAESTLAFLGLGDPTAVSWGTTLQLARQVGAVSAGDWWVLLPPGVAIAGVCLAFTVCGRAIESALNPRLARRP